MKNRLMTIATALALVIILARVFEKPLLAQIRAALTQNVDEPGRNPFTLTSGGISGVPYTGAWTVPNGKRYVIDQFTVQCIVPSSDYMSGIRLYTTNDGLNESTFDVAHLVEPDGSDKRIYVGSGTARLYADPGSPIYLVAQNGSGLGSGAADVCAFYVNGYVINNP